MSDELLDLAIQGDRVALSDLLTRCHDRIRKFARTRLGQDLRTYLSTSDILQSTYLDVVKGVVKFDGNSEEDFARWVCQIMENNLKDRGRYFGAKKRQMPDAPRLDAELAQTSKKGPASAALVAEELALVFEALGNLSEDQRRIYVLHVFEGRSHAECAEIMNKTEVAARSLLARGRAALALRLDELRESDTKS